MITEAQRNRRQAADDGDPETTVYYHASRGNDCYHEVRRCALIATDEPKSTTRKGAKLKWLAPCTNCTIDGIPPAPDEGGESA